MKLVIDTDKKTLTKEENGHKTDIQLYSKEAFMLVSDLWLKLGWNEKYVYTFSWLGRPIIQLPEDLIRIQEIIYNIKPDIILETGIAHGGSLIYYASLCKIIGKGRVLGVDIEIRPHNLEAIKNHELATNITMIEGDSVAPEIINSVKRMIKPTDVVLILLDSNHTKNHVLKELEAYCGLVSLDSYIIATDGIMRDLSDVPRGSKEWKEDNPYRAAEEFITSHPEFIIEQPPWPFNESNLKDNITHWPGAWLKRIK